MEQGYEKRNAGFMWAVIGMSRCGKTSYTASKVKLNKAKRLLVWDPAGQFANKLGCITVRSSKELWGYIIGNKGNGKFALNFMGSGEFKKQEFSNFCYIAFYWGILKPCDVVAEELGQVTNPAKASGYWYTLVSNGLKYGINIYGIAQRTQEIDNTILGNCTFNTLFMVNHSLGVDVKKAKEVLGEEPPKEFYKFVEKNNQTLKNKHGTTLSNGGIKYF